MWLCAQVTEEDYTEINKELNVYQALLESDHRKLYETYTAFVDMLITTFS